MTALRPTADAPDPVLQASYSLSDERTEYLIKDRLSFMRFLVHFMRNALAHAGKSGRCLVSAFVATAFAQDNAASAKQQWRRVADQLPPKVPNLANLMDEAEPDVLAYMTFRKRWGGRRPALPLHDT